MIERVAHVWEGLPADDLARRWGAPAARVYETLGSTNDVARRLAAEGARPGTVVLAEEQTAGRGRAGRSWSSPPGTGLWFSVIAAPLDDTAPAFLPLRVGLAVAAALDGLLRGAKVGLKWPNDLCVGERKLGGILCEATWEGARSGAVVAGVGLNIQQSAEEFPPEIRGSATSLAIEARGPVARLEIADRVIPAVLGAVVSGVQLNAAELNARDLLRGHRVAVTDPMTGRSIVAGLAEGIGSDGALLVRDGGGAVQRVTSGTVRRM